LRAQWPGLAALTALIALVGGLAMGSVQGARLTASSYSDFSRTTHVPDVYVLDGTYNPALGLSSAYNPALLRRLTRLPHVERVESNVSLNIGPVTRQSTIDPASIGTTATGTVDGLDFNEDTVVVTQGRMLNPKRTDEFVLDSATAKRFGVHLGQLVHIGWVDNTNAASPSPVVPADQQRWMRLVGIGATQSNSLFQDQDTAESTAIELFSPAFTSRLLQCCSNTMFSGLTVRGGDRNDAAVEREVRSALPQGFPFIGGPTDQNLARASRTLRPEAIALATFGGIAGLATLLIAGQLIGRRLRFRADDMRILRALGATPTVILGDGLIGPAAALLAGSLLAGVVALALSPLAPLGPVGPLFPTALRPDWTVIGLGVAILIVGLGVVALVAAALTAPHRTARSRRSRPSVLARAATSSGLPPSAVAGVRFALEPGVGRSAVPVRSAMLGGVLALVVVTATITFGASLRTLVSHPALYGWNWTFAMNGGGGVGDVPGAAAATLLHQDPSVARWTGVYFSSLEIDGLDVPVLGGRPGAGVSPPLLSGHGFERPNEVVLGSATLAALHKRLGDTVVVQGAGGRATLTVVGTATLPSIGVAGSAHLEMGEGALLSENLIPASERNIFNVTPGPNEILVQIEPHADPAAAFAALQAIGRRLQIAGNGGVVEGVQRPAEILNYQSLGTTPTLLGAALAAGAVVALGLTLVTSVRRRRPDFALLKTLGFRKQQLAAAVAWQSTVAVTIGCLVGIPLGVALGRVLWDLFARGINAVPDPVVPWGSLFLIGAAAIVLANVVAAVPGRLAARTPTARLLRTD
jgi:hypothetical protein